jgi:hypothetical protein
MKASVYFADDQTKTAFLALASSTAEEREIHMLLNGAFDALALDAFCGIQVPKRLIPKAYLAKYGIDNLWKFNFFKNWRLMYTVVGNGTTVIALILEWLSQGIRAKVRVLAGSSLNRVFGNAAAQEDICFIRNFPDDGIVHDHGNGIG